MRFSIKKRKPINEHKRKDFEVAYERQQCFWIALRRLLQKSIENTEQQHSIPIGKQRHVRRYLLEAIRRQNNIPIDRSRRLCLQHHKGTTSLSRNGKRQRHKNLY